MVAVQRWNVRTGGIPKEGDRTPSSIHLMSHLRAGASEIAVDEPAVAVVGFADDDGSAAAAAVKTPRVNDDGRFHWEERRGYHSCISHARAR